MAAGTTVLKLGWTDPLTGVFGGHPVFGAALDLNDGVTFTLVDGGLALPPPRRTLVAGGNIRTQGERVTRALYRHNREVGVRLVVGPGASYAALVASLRGLVAWLDGPPSVPVTLLYQQVGASAPVYLDVVGAAHDLPEGEGEWLRLQLEPIEITLVCRPGLRGDRVTLQNLVVNPGFEAPSGPAVQVFSDSFASVAAYSVLGGAAPSVAGGVLTLPAGTLVGFGSPAWGALAAWTLRVQTPGAAGWDLQLGTHNGATGDTNNRVWVNVFNGSIELHQTVGGVDHVLGTAATGVLANATWYWLTITQYPGVVSGPGTPPMMQATLSADAAGAVGGQIATVGPVATFDAVTALTGRPSLWANTGTWQVGGAFPGVHTVSLFGPGGWGASDFVGVSSYAWEQSTANTFGGGPVTSFGAARIDAPPAGTWNALWKSYNGGAVAGVAPAPAAIPVSGAGNTLGVSVWCRSVGLSAGAFIALYVAEFDANGGYLRQTVIQTVGGNQAGWRQLSGSVVTGATCAYVAVWLNPLDTSAAGASANATVWFENAQCWNQSTTGQTTMPYCELRFGQSPAQLVVSGLLGDLPAPTALALGTYLGGSWPAGGSVGFALGRRGRADANARLVGGSYGATTAAYAPVATPTGDATAYGGYWLSALVGSGGWNPRAFSLHGGDAPGVYHLVGRFLSKQGTANLGNVAVRVVTNQQGGAWFPKLDGSDLYATVNGPTSAPLAGGVTSTWTVVDAGQVAIPPGGGGALVDASRTWLVPRTQWTDSTAGGGAQGQANWQALLPIDGALLVGVVNNPSNTAYAVASQWLWVYVDGLLVNRAGVGPGAGAGGGLGAGGGDGAATTYSLEGATALANPARGAGGPGTATSGPINVNQGADPYLTVDPTVSVQGTVQGFGGGGGGGGLGTVGQGVNQLVGYLADQAGAVLALYAEVVYTPLYLYPR